ncbi:MAG: phage tail tube protein [Acidobacteriota bacterium]|nr:phage tail tube protein [Acidobacteriota bacterium]
MPYDIFAGWGEQAAYGTAVARAQFARVYDGSAVTHKHPGDPHTYLGRADPETIHYGLEYGEWTLEPVPVYDGIGKLFKHALGSVTDAGAGPYTHTHSLADSLPANGLSIELHKGLDPAGAESKLITGGKINEFAFEASVGEELKIRFGGIGQKATIVAKTASPTYPDYDNDIVKVSQISVQIDGATTNVTGISVSLNNNLRTDRGFLGSQYIAEPTRAGNREITGQVDKEWEDATLYNKFLSGATATLLITCTGSGSNKLTIRCNEIVFLGDVDEELTQSEKIGQTLPFVARHDATYGALQIVETNGTATT